MRPRSRNDKDFKRKYPTIAKALAALPDETVVDGDVVALDEAERPWFVKESRLGLAAETTDDSAAHFGRNPPQLRIEPQAGFPRRRNLCRQKRHSEPSPAHFAQLADLALQVGDHFPIRQPAIVQPFRERGQRGTWG